MLDLVEDDVSGVGSEGGEVNARSLQFFKFGDEIVGDFIEFTGAHQRDHTFKIDAVDDDGRRSAVGFLAILRGQQAIVVDG